MPSTPVTDSNAPAEPGTLFIVATPIGNLDDITLRALDVLRSVSLIAAEDTRHTRKLLSFYNIHKPLVSYHSHNIRVRGPELLKRISAGTSVALVTDAGTPAISDPGALLVGQALERNLPVAVIPGPAALISALVASGLPTQPFAFLGFPPTRGSGRRQFFSAHANLPMTLILYESPQRLTKTLDDMLRSWGDRRIAIARELTKKFEEFFRGSLSEAAKHYANGTRGELTLVVEGFAEDHVAGEEEGSWREALALLLEDPNRTLKEATANIVCRYGLPRRLVYQTALAMQNAEHSRPGPKS
jgi:16S rRNA (cytidine1402-2'-O)-methyltransferase